MSARTTQCALFLKGYFHYSEVLYSGFNWLYLDNLLACFRIGSECQLFLFVSCNAAVIKVSAAGSALCS